MSTWVVIGCGKKKRLIASRAVDLYLGPLYRKRLLFARRMGGPHWILSAMHELIDPGRIVAPYDKTLVRMSTDERSAWSDRVATELLKQTVPGDTIVVLAGADYFRGWRSRVEAKCRKVVVPVVGSIGRQMAELKRRLG